MNGFKCLETSYAQASASTQAEATLSERGEQIRVSESREREVQGLVQSLTPGPLPASWENGPYQVILRKEPFIISIFFFWPHCAACGILVPQPEVEPVAPALEARSLNHWTAREVPYFHQF